MRVRVCASREIVPSIRGVLVCGDWRRASVFLYRAALMEACNCVQELLSAGARTDVRNRDDCTANDIAEIQQVLS